MDTDLGEANGEEAEWFEEDRDLSAASSPRRQGKMILEQMAEETGTRMLTFQTGRGSIRYSPEIQEELRNQYKISYTPDGDCSSRAFLKIHLSAREKDRIVETREGYHD